MTSGSTPGFPQRNGFALQRDLDSPALQDLLQLCLHENEAFGGGASLDWSRQWEYPWVLGNLPLDGGGRRLLDAGSGYRFFTPMLAKRGFEVDACDLDPGIGPRLDEVAARDDLPIEFTSQDLTKMGYADASFDYICCVSVLEHAADPEGIAAEFHRCLKPGGTLLLTFDVSIRGDRHIPVPRARDLVGRLFELFTPRFPFAGRDWLEDASVLAESDEALRTTWFRRHRPELLPWRFLSRAFLQNLLRGRVGRPFFDLSVVGLVLDRPDA